MFVVIDDHLVDYSEDEKPQRYTFGNGIAGVVGKSHKEIAITSWSNDPYYNPIVDINTTSSIIAFPIMSDEKDEILAVMEV